ncbi:MAG: UDP-N-acetylmuramoyl-L-alanine--D-glutamate ligase, partial [bacterium]|nr:UDP-N-acetylmuramoyl-L-alanine--D-glutamate ligase [bacterium]
DSKATNPEASNVAINSFPNKKVVLIAGGRDKNTPLDEFVSYIKDRIEKVVLIGEASERFKTALLNIGFNNIREEKTLEGAIDEAGRENPDVVLFSPACASFDMFDNFEVRGECFKNYVLKKRASE